MNRESHISNTLTMVTKISKMLLAKMHEQCNGYLDFTCSFVFIQDCNVLTVPQYSMIIISTEHSVSTPFMHQPPYLKFLKGIKIC